MIYPGLKTLTPGVAKGRIALLSEPLSLWGGLDPDDGTICDVNHPQHGLSLSGKVLAMRAARGSSSSSTTLVEVARRGIGPTAIILGRIDPILVIGSLVAADLYAIAVPIILLPEHLFDRLPAHAHVEVLANNETATLHVDA
jgi:uncharacterized protein